MTMLLIEWVILYGDESIVKVVKKRLIFKWFMILNITINMRDF